MRRARRIVTLVLIAGGVLWGVWEFAPIQTISWDGGFELTVHVSSSTEPLRRVSCEVFHDRADAQQTLEHLLPPQYGRYAIADPFEEQPLKVNVLVGGRSMGPMSENHSFEWERSRSQERSLVVIAEFKDGRRVGKLVEIPDGRVSQEVSVSFP